MKKTAKLQIGKNGLTEDFVTQVKKIFEKVDSVRISVLKSACRDKEEFNKIADSLVDRLGKNYNYRKIGYVMVVNKYRRNVRD